MPAASPIIVVLFCIAAVINRSFYHQLKQETKAMNEGKQRTTQSAQLTACDKVLDNVTNNKQLVSTLGHITREIRVASGSGNSNSKPCGQKGTRSLSLLKFIVVLLC